MSFVVVGTSPPSDLTTNDWEDLVYKYLGGNWSLTGDLTKVKVFRTATVADMVNQPERSLHPYWIWVEFEREVGSRTKQGPPGLTSTLGSRGYVAHSSTFRIHLFTYRLKPSLTFPEMGQMAREVHRLLFSYPLNPPTEDIPGLKYFDNWENTDVRSASDLGESFGGVFQKIVRIDAVYWYGFT